MSDLGPPGQQPVPLPPGKPPFAPPPGTPYYGPPHDAEWTPPPGTVFGGGPDVLASSGRGRRDRSAWPAVARPVHAGDPDEQPDKGSRAVALLLAIAAIVGAIVTAQASLVGSDATSAWQQSVANEQRRGALLLEGVRYTYGAEGDMALMVATAVVRAQELRALAEGQPPEIAAELIAEAQVHEQVVEMITPASGIASDPRYALPSGGYDIQLRLADSRNETPADVAIDPIADVVVGDADADKANRLIATTLGIGVAFLFGALAQAFAQQRRLLLLIGWGFLAASGVAAFVVQVTA